MSFSGITHRHPARRGGWGPWAPTGRAAGHPGGEGCPSSPGHPRAVLRVIRGQKGVPAPLTLSPSSPGGPTGPAGPGSPTGPWRPSRPAGPWGPFSPYRGQKIPGPTELPRGNVPPPLITPKRRGPQAGSRQFGAVTLVMVPVDFSYAEGDSELCPAPCHPPPGTAAFRPCPSSRSGDTAARRASSGAGSQPSQQGS